MKKLVSNNIRSFSGFSLFRVFIFIISTLLLLIACSPKSGPGLLRFFFDGVGEKKMVDAGATAPQKDTVRHSLLRNQDTLANGLFVHMPYKERACLKCHGADVPGTTVYNQDAFCYTCHKNFNESYDVTHGPVAAGFCTACHTPHVADNKKLLRREGQALCLGCHEPEMVFKNETHSEIGKKDCTECHNPHGGSDRAMQK